MVFLPNAILQAGLAEVPVHVQGGGAALMKTGALGRGWILRAIFGESFNWLGRDIKGTDYNGEVNQNFRVAQTFCSFQTSKFWWYKMSYPRLTKIPQFNIVIYRKYRFFGTFLSWGFFSLLKPFAVLSLRAILIYSAVEHFPCFGNVVGVLHTHMFT